MMPRCLTSSLLCLFVSSVAVLQPSADSPTEQEEGAVHLPAVRRQHRPADDDPHLAQLAGRLHQQLALQLCGQQLVRTPVGRRPQVTSRTSVSFASLTTSSLCCFLSFASHFLIPFLHSFLTSSLFPTFPFPFSASSCLLSSATSSFLPCFLI